MPNHIYGRVMPGLFAVVLMTMLLAQPVLAQGSSAAIIDLKQITEGNFLKLYPNIGPEGRRLIYQAKPTGSAPFNVYMIDLGAADKPKRLTNERFVSENVRWAGEEGKYIVFDSNRIPGTRYVWRKELAGVGGINQISAGETFDFQADVSPDGAKAVFCSWQKGKIKSPSDGDDRIWMIKKAKNLPQIQVMDLSKRTLSFLAQGVNPAWDPEGKRVAFASNVTGNYEIYMVNADGSNPQQITSFEGPDVEPAWSPDGLFISFVRLQNKNWNVWMVEIATGKQTQLTINEAVDGGPTWGVDGTIYFHSNRSGSWDIWSMKPAGYQVVKEAEPEPVLDTDGDGYQDDVDLCVSDAEDFDGFEDEDGCPDMDNDGDGILDTADRCPLDPETKNLYKDTDGCPDKSPVKAKMILFGVLFKSGKADLSPDSVPFLDAFAELMKDDARANIEIRGYTDDVGKDTLNLTLSQKRAETVRQYLMLKGIGEERMTAVGYGEADPLCTEKTNECRTRNRRIEVMRTN